MLAKIFIKAYIVLCCIQVALWGYLHQDMLWIAIACINIGAIFVILFQERKVFAHVGSSRVLFSYDVFAYLAVAVGLIGATWRYTGNSVFSVDVQRLLVVLFGGIFYVLSVRLFGMFGDRKFSDIVSMRILSFLLAGIFAYICIGYVSFTGVSNWWNSFTTSVDEVVSVPDMLEIENEGITGKSDASEVDALLENIDTTKNDENNDVVGDTTDTSLLTFATALPKIIDMYDLGPAKGGYTFSFVAQDSALYESFAIAREYTMIGSATRPEQPVLCKHLMVLLGLAEGWDVVVTGDVFDAYRNMATDTGYIGTCIDQNQQARMSDVPSISIP